MFTHLSQSLEFLLFTLPQRLPQENRVIPLSGFIILFGLSELCLELLNVLLIALLLAMLKAPNLVLETSSHITLLGEGHLIVPQCLERVTRCVELRSECTRKRSGDVVQKT
jgi:hypothetical protein